MANSLDRQILEEGYRNAIVKLTGVLADSDIYETPAIALTDFSNNEPRGALVGFRVDLVEYSISPGVEVVLEWNSLNPQIIYPLAGHGKMCATAYGGLQPNMSLIDYDGSINLRTVGFATAAQVSPQTFSIIIELIKLYKGGI